MNVLIDGQTLETPEINRGIGVYFKNVLNNMIKLSFEHSWYITVTKKEALSALDPWVAERLIPIVDEAFSPCSDFGRLDKYTNALENAISSNSIDILWIPNPMMVNVLFPLRAFDCKTIATFYDLIPFIKPVKEWGKEVATEYNRRLSYIKNESIPLLCISNFTKKDYETHISTNNHFYVTSLAADYKKFYRKKTKLIEKKEPYIVFTGGFDYRKNIDGAIEAFSKALKIFPDDRQLEAAKMFIVCSASKETEKAFDEKLNTLGLTGKVKLTGFISDAELSNLYENADLFFFPSLYEGFGLPILEAMLGGAYVLSADNSSLPEICGGHAMLCNAENTEEMAEKLQEALHSSINESLEEKQKRQAYALTYSWEKTAQETLAAFELELYSKSSITTKRKLAICTPWPEQKTGIANYVYKLMPHLSVFFDIDIFVDNTVVSNERFLDNSWGKLYMIEELEARHSEYDVLLYQIGNSSDFHKGVYINMKKYPGIADIHDYIINPFFYHSLFLKRNFKAYKDALRDGYGSAGDMHYEKIKERVISPDNEKFPMCHSVINISKSSIFHNHWAVNEAKSPNTHLVPLACFDPEDMEEEGRINAEARIREKIQLKDNEIIIGVFGFVNQNKRPDKIVEAVRRLVDEGRNIRTVFFGSCENMDFLGKDFNTINNNTVVTGFLDKEEYEAGLTLSHIVVNLRYPSMGESSATLCEAMKFGKPVIVSDINQYREYPDEVCWKVPVDSRETEVLFEMLKYLIDNEDVRKALGENAKFYADNLLSPKKIAELYYRIISKII